MKPEHFRAIHHKPSCMNCKYMHDSPGMNESGLSIAGISEHRCIKHDFIIVPMTYMPSFETRNKICNDWESKNEQRNSSGAV